MFDFLLLEEIKDKNIYKDRLLRFWSRVYKKNIEEMSWEHFFANKEFPSKLLVYFAKDKIVGTANLIPQTINYRNSSVNYYLFRI